jgi:hypothetical protein
MPQESLVIDIVLSSISVTPKVSAKTLISYWKSVFSNTIETDAFQNRIEQIVPGGDVDITLSLSISVAPAAGETDA